MQAVVGTLASRALRSAGALRTATYAIQASGFATAPPATASSSGGSSRRARRLRRSKSSDGAGKGILSEVREAMKIVSNIGETSRSGIQQRVEMPEEMLRRVTTVVKRRTHSQLEALREKYVHDEKNTRQIPLDMHKNPIGWTLEKTSQIPAYLYGPTETMAYLAYEVEGTYACAHHVFRQLQAQNPDFQPQSMLDFGAGPGTASWVAKEFYDESLTKYRVVEPSQSMVDASEVILEGFPGLSVRRSISEMKREIEGGIKFDLIVLNYVLSEITNDYERVAVMSALWELLSDKGCMVVVDRGSPWGSHHVRSARQFILDSVAEEEEEDTMKILAPCPHHFECPAAGSTWCHFVQRSPQVNRPREATPKRWHGQKGSKFSYVIMEKNSKAVADAAKKQPFARLIRSPLLATRHVHLDLCTPEGELERRSVTKGKHLREVYRASRKAHWGAQWPADASIYTDKKD
uniref:Ribosomal small subunit Rsm22 n=1 Tax=Globisporangium ultimum (strain ATCC 200006 / CBS 805.95 / DAOM BR144) TaxID=431595 RepID=K3WRH2_GLOUD